MIFKQQQSKISHLTLAIGASLGLWLLMVIIAPTRTQAAACTAPTTDFGSVTITLNVPADASSTTSPTNFKVWTRMMASNSNDNSYLLEIDGNTCFTVGDSAISSSSWTWVDYQNATSSSKITKTLTPGNHTLKLIGREASVKLDKLILLAASDTCVPAGFGDNCSTVTPPVTTYPYNNKVLERPDGRAYYVKDGKSYIIDNPAIRNCIIVRRATGKPVATNDATVDLYAADRKAWCNYEQEVGLNFVREQTKDKVWLVRSGGTKDHVGVLCHPDAYGTSAPKKYRVFVVPLGEAAGHTKGPDFFGTPTKCAALPG
jgi:hypothetical protein